jgi:hypothetical protein
VLVREVVCVHELRLRGRQDVHKVGQRIRVLRVAQLARRVVEQELCRILADDSGLLLLLPAHGHHLLVGVVRVETVPRAARAVRAGDAGEPPVREAEALEDPVVGHDLKVILMRADAHVRCAAEGLLDGQRRRG